MSSPGAAADHDEAVADRRRCAWLAVISLLAVVSVLVAGWQFLNWRTDVELRAQRAAARSAVPQLVADVFSYTPATVGADNRRARTRVSEGFAAAHASAFGAQRTGGATWRAHTVGIAESGDGWAEAVAVVEVTDPARKEPAADRIVSMRLIQERGRWLLDAVELIR